MEEIEQLVINVCPDELFAIHETSKGKYHLIMLSKPIVYNELVAMKLRLDLGCDIEYAHIFDHTLEQNSMRLDKRNDGRVFVYHSFRTRDRTYSGRWYDFLDRDAFIWDDDDKQITYRIPEWEVEDDGVYEIIKDVPITVKFNERGWSKLTSMFN